MANPKKKHVEVRPRENPTWYELVELFINSPEHRVSYYPDDSELYVTIERTEYRSLVLRKDGTWALN